MHYDGLGYCNNCQIRMRQMKSGREQPPRGQSVKISFSMGYRFLREGNWSKLFSTWTEENSHMPSYGEWELYNNFVFIHWLKCRPVLASVTVWVQNAEFIPKMQKILERGFCQGQWFADVLNGSRVADAFTAVWRKWFLNYLAILIALVIQNCCQPARGASCTSSNFNAPRQRRSYSRPSLG